MPFRNVPKLPRQPRDVRARRRAVLEERIPYVAVHAQDGADEGDGPADRFKIATYNVHRWTGVTGGRTWSPQRAFDVIAELDADVLALQEVLRPFDADDPLCEIADELGFHFAFAATRAHRRGELGNAILSRWPISCASMINLSFGRLEQRSAVEVQFVGSTRNLSIVATHLAIVDRTRKQQVQSLLEHAALQGPALLLGDMNAWRRCRATRQLEAELTTQHDNANWPASYPATRPLLSLDRIYARSASILSLEAHSTAAARRASDHLPVVATVSLTDAE